MSGSIYRPARPAGVDRMEAGDERREPMPEKPKATTSLNKRTEALAKQVREAAATIQDSTTYEGFYVHIDLTAPQGRWELLALAVLLAARVSETVAEITFQSLKDRGLLDLWRLYQASATDIQQVHEIIALEYRAFTPRERKAEALIHNAGLLINGYDGDLDNIYRSYLAGRRETVDNRKGVGLPGLSKMIAQFTQVGQRSRWLCRTMHEAGLWTQAELGDRYFIDNHVYRAALRLGLITAHTPWTLAKEEIDEVVARLFEGDPIYLYKLGRYFCLPAKGQKECWPCPCRKNCRASGALW